MSNRTIEAILKLSAKVGNLSAFAQVGSKLADIDRKAKAYNRSQGMIARGANAATAAMMRFAAPAALAYGGARAFKGFAEAERRLERIGINADASREKMDGVKASLRDMAQEMRVPFDQVVTGLENMVAAGASLDEAMTRLPAIMKTTQAAGADAGEIATTADAIANSFGIAGNRMERAFDILAKGGKAGKFELRDMAGELPSLAPAFAALGYRGEAGLKKLTAALQTVRMETGQSGEAATAFMDVISKIESTAVQANFSKRFGVDLAKEMKKAKAAGEDVLDAFVRISRETVKGDLSKLPQLFTDKQMLVGMRALINHGGEMRDLFRDLGDATGTVDRDFQRLANDGQASLDRLANSWDRLTNSIGKGIDAMGASGAMAGISDVIDTGIGKNEAVAKEMARRGHKGFFARERAMWNMSATDRANLPWMGGYRTDEERKAIDAYAAYAASKSAAPKKPVDHGPIPSPRPDYQPPRKFPRAYGPTPMQLPLLALPNVPSVDVPFSGAGIKGAFNAFAGFEDKIAAGGEKAAASIEQSGPKAGVAMGDAASSAIMAGATAAGNAFGQAAAAQIRAAASSIPARTKGGYSDFRPMPGGSRDIGPAGEGL